MGIWNLCHEAQDYPHPDYTADDDTFRPLWDKGYVSLSRKNDVILCETESENGKWISFEFDYAGY